MATRKTKGKGKGGTGKGSVRKAASKVGARKPPRKVARRKSAAKAKAKAKRKVAPIPKGYHSLTPYLIVKGAGEAMAFYARAFGAREKLRLTMPGGGVMHAEIRIGDSYLMLTEENPEWGAKSPLALGGNGTHVMIYVRDVDAAFARAVAAGCTVEMAVADMFWGDRYGKLRDPYGHQWSICTHIADLPQKKIQQLADAEMAKMAAQGKG
jgi:uncharacterized glyoxalase superfamily protein PhnB